MSQSPEPRSNGAGASELRACPVCQSALVPGLEPWHWLCKQCGYEKAELQPTINARSSHKLIDEGDREKGLRDLRVLNFRTLLDEIRREKPSGRLLDVGCAHGWFLETARSDYEVVGIEPDEDICKATQGRGLPVRQGFFPEVLAEGERFDVIVFNDVLEHIPDIQGVLAACRERLHGGGLLVLNLPSSRGSFYRLSKALRRLGVRSHFDRLWQKGLPSPHLHYVNPQNLSTLIRNSGFDPVREGILSTLRLSGLYTRVSYTGGHGVVVRVAIYLCLVLALPILKVLPSDIIYIVARRQASS
ncbi:MAG: class I SAM-dependent methyltransferase [Planctomycetota bacterium]